MPKRSWTERSLHGLHLLELLSLAALLISMVLIATTQIVLRNFFDTGLIWADPLLRAMLLWLGLLGAVAASYDNKHISIDLFSRLMPASFLPWTRIATSLFTALVCLVVAYHSGRFVLDEITYQSPSDIASGIPAWLLEIIIPIAFALIALRYFLLIGRYWSRKQVGTNS